MKNITMNTYLETFSDSAEMLSTAKRADAGEKNNLGVSAEKLEPD